MKFSSVEELQKASVLQPLEHKTEYSVKEE